MRVYIIFLCFIFTYVANSQQITTTEWTRLIPSAAIPKNIKIRHSNNNIDLVFFNNKYYLAFRTAPNHFASRKTKIYILASADLQKWEYETEFSVNADMREPRFLVYKNSLYFYFFEGGKRPLKFQPKHIWATYTNGNKIWSNQQNINLDGYVPWRLKVRNDTAYLSAYYGVNLYKNNHKAELRLFYSTNGIDFQPVSKQPQIATKGAEEGEFDFDKEGNLWATIRLEGSGSFVVFADKNNLTEWKTTFSHKKYDSALMFHHKGECYVIARRHLGGNGNATQVENPTRAQRRRNLRRYSFSKKRTALYKLDKETMQLVHIQDFPSCGDNAFPAIAPIDENSYLLFNYSNDFNKKDKKWIWGQLSKTYIYYTTITFP